MTRRHVPWLLSGFLVLFVAAAATAETTDISELFPAKHPDIEISSFAARAQRYFEEADINVIALASHPDRPDDAIAALLQQYRRQMLRGRMELARARAVHQPVQPVFVVLEQFTAEHLKALQALLPQLSTASQQSVRHTLHLVAQLHQSAQAGLMSKRTDQSPGTVRVKKRTP